MADHAVKYQTDGLITGAFMMRKIALKIQWAKLSLDDWEGEEGKMERE